MILWCLPSRLTKDEKELTNPRCTPDAEFEDPERSSKIGCLLGNLWRWIREREPATRPATDHEPELLGGSFSSLRT